MALFKDVSLVVGFHGSKSATIPSLCTSTLFQLVDQGVSSHVPAAMPLFFVLPCHHHELQPSEAVNPK